MENTPVYNQEGKQVSTVELPKAMWQVAMNVANVHQAVIVQQANARTVLAHTKTRGEVRGGGRKPWKQKGTGRARQGSIRSPLWVGGGITFGPRKDRNYEVNMNKKAKKKALYMVLSNKLAEGKIVILDELKPAQLKTKETVKIIKNMPVKAKSYAIILSKDNADVARTVRNTKNMATIGANSLNVYDLLKYEAILIPKKSLDVMHNTYLAKA